MLKEYISLPAIEKFVPILQKRETGVRLTPTAKDKIVHALDQTFSDKAFKAYGSSVELILKQESVDEEEHFKQLFLCDQRTKRNWFHTENT